MMTPVVIAAVGGLVTGMAIAALAYGAWRLWRNEQASRTLFIQPFGVDDRDGYGGVTDEDLIAAARGSARFASRCIRHEGAPLTEVQRWVIIEPLFEALRRLEARS